MEVQLEFNFFDWQKYEASRAQAIVNNITPVIGEEPQEPYHDFIKRMLKNDRETWLENIKAY